MILDREVRLEHMSWVDAKEAVLESGGVVLVPVGAVETHGPHLPLGTDSLETIEIGHRAAMAAGVVMCPPIWYGNSRSFMDFPGTVTLRPETLKEVVKDVVLSLLTHGFNKPVILDGHGGNYGILDVLAEDIHIETSALVFHVRAWDMATLPKPDGIPKYDGHGGYSETSVMMYLFPNDVNEKRFVDSQPEIDVTKYGSVFPAPSSLYSKGPAVLPLSMDEMVEHGHHGDPSWGDSEKGKALLDVKVNALVEFLSLLKRGEIKTRKPTIIDGG